jgi:hypothetical protein
VPDLHRSELRPQLRPQVRLADRFARTAHLVRHRARYGVVVLLAALAVSSMGCRKIRQKIEEKAAEQAIKAGTGGAVAVNEGDQGGLTLKDNKGNVVTLGQTKVPADWPSNVPVYSGKVVSAVSSKDQGKTAQVVMIETTDTPDAVFTFYKSKLASFEQQSEMSSNQMRMLVVEDKKSKMHVSVVVGTSGANTTVQVAATQG